jgi:hypothetical protein
MGVTGLQGYVLTGFSVNGFTGAKIKTALHKKAGKAGKYAQRVAVYPMLFKFYFGIIA